MLAVDSVDDDQTLYDTFFFAPDSDGEQATGGNTLQLTLGEWGTLPGLGRDVPSLVLAVTGLRTLTTTATLGPTVDITPTATLTPTVTLTPTPTATLTPTASSAPLLELTLYHIAAQPVMAQPVALGQEVIERFGFCPPLPDPNTVAQGRLSPAAFRELASLRAAWTMRAATYVYETYRPHLLMVRQEALSPSEQALLLTDDRQPGYSPARAAEFADHRRTVAAAVDDGLDSLLAAIDLNYAAILIVSEYGVAPAHTEVNVTAAVRPVWQWLAQVDGGLLPSRALPEVHVEGAFLSIEVERDGKERRLATEALIRELAALTDPRTGQRVLARVSRRRDAGPWATAWPCPGDIVAQAAPGYTLTAAPGARDIFSDTPVYGQMGYSIDQPAMHGTLVAAGRGVSAGQEDITSLTSLTHTAVKCLNVVPPPSNNP
jgi:hypothetical protein